jgi:protein-tyrosine phosphatase
MERRIDLAGCHNFRDLGGYPASGGLRVRWRRLFRSDALHHLTPEAVDRLIGELGVGVIVDLRSTGEIGADGHGLLRDRTRAYHHLPLFDGPLDVDPELLSRLDLAGRYGLLLDHAKLPIARVLGALAEAPAPAVVHCTVGKDRTGLIAAVVLGLLGVPDEIIAADYAATGEHLDAIVDRLVENAGYRDALRNLPPDTLHAEPATMLALLAQLRDRYGSLRGYADAIGLSAAQIERLRDRLLEERLA